MYSFSPASKRRALKSIFNYVRDNLLTPAVRLLFQRLGGDGSEIGAASISGKPGRGSGPGSTGAGTVFGAEVGAFEAGGVVTGRASESSL
jgi:hypothetical protein